MIRLQLSGYPTVSSEGTTLSGPVTQRHRLALLALLALAPNRTMPRDKLFALLWPDADITSARHLLNTAVNVIRNAAGESVLISRRDEIALSVDVRVDMLEFQELIERGEPLPATQLYRAPFLDGFFLESAGDFEQWTSRERVRLNALYHGALESAAEMAERDGALAVAVQRWRALALNDPYNSRAVIRLMLALERTGDHGNALQVAQEHEVLLARELEAEPTGEFRELVRRLRERPNGIAETSLAASARSSATSIELHQPKEPPPDAALAHTASARPRSLRGPLIAAGLVVIVGATAAGLNALRPPDIVPSRVVVSLFENETGDSTMNRLATLIADFVLRGAGQVPMIEAIDLKTLGDLATDSRQPGIRLERTRRLAARSGAGTVVLGSLVSRHDSIRIEATVADLQSGRVRRSVRMTLPMAGDIARVDLEPFRERLLGALAMEFDDRLSTVAAPEDAAPRLDAYREFAAGVDAFDQGDYAIACDHFTRAYGADSTFTKALVWTAFARYHGALYGGLDSLTQALLARKPSLPLADRFGLQWLSARMRGDVPAAYRAAREAIRLAPTSQWAHSFASVALELKRPHEALRALEGLDADRGWVRGWTGYRNVLAGALHLLGRYNEEHVLARGSRRHATNLYVQLISEARPLAAMGRAQELHRLIDEALALPDQPNMDPGSLMQRAARELDAHGFGDAARTIWLRAAPWYERQVMLYPEVGAPRWALGNVRYALGQLDSARVAYETLGGGYRAQAHLGIVAARQGRRADAAVYDSLLAIPPRRLNSFDASIREFYRACISALLGDRERAIAHLQQAVAMGVPVPMDSIHVDEALASLRGLPAFDQLVRIQDR